MARVNVFTANAFKLAATNYNDTTGFVQIMEENDLDDFLINTPIQVLTVADAMVSTNQLVFSPTDGIKVGWLVSGQGLDGFGVVLNVRQTYSIAGLPFCDCINNRHLPPMGKRLSTVVCVSPNLIADVPVGTPIIFSVGILQTIVIPTLPSTTNNGRVT